MNGAKLWRAPEGAIERGSDECSGRGGATSVLGNDNGDNGCRNQREITWVLGVLWKGNREWTNSFGYWLFALRFGGSG